MTGSERTKVIRLHDRLVVVPSKLRWGATGRWIASLIVITSITAAPAQQRPNAARVATTSPAAPATQSARGLQVMQRPPTTHETLTDEEVGKTLDRAARLIIGNLQKEGGAAFRRESILSVYALLAASQAIDDEQISFKNPFFQKCVEAMKRYPRGGTYAMALRAAALSLYNRKEDRATIKADAGWLMAAHTKGAYTYGSFQGRDARGEWDNSNSQYGLLGVWSGAEVGVEVPDVYWKAVQTHWEKFQDPASGRFPYCEFSDSIYAPNFRLSMTQAGLVSLIITDDYLDAVKWGDDVGREPFRPAAAKALQFLETGDNCFSGEWSGYEAYGMERAGLATGFKYFGTHDWYRETAVVLVNALTHRLKTIGMCNEEVNLAYYTLFLARGRHPVLMNKLRFDGYWANRPRDLANLTRFASQQLERPFNWQVVPLNHDWTDWNESPVLYLASHQAPPIRAPEIEKIRQFIVAGGLLFTQADGSSKAFDTYARDLARKLFPEYELVKLPPDHALYNLDYKVNPPPELWGVSNGVRLLMVHSPQDLSRHWQMRAEKSHANAFQIGVNLFIYAAGKQALHNRLDSPYLPPPPEGRQVLATMKVARLRYLGNWDPEPGAWVRFSRWFDNQTSVGLDVQIQDLGHIDNLDPTKTPFAHITFAAPYTPSPAEARMLAEYVKGGGVLLMDVSGGSREVADAIRSQFLSAVFGNRGFESLLPSHPVLTASAPGMEDLSKPQYRPYVVAKFGPQPGGTIPIEHLPFGKGHVFYSRYDLTSGLLGTQTWGIAGFGPEYASRLMKNLVLWTINNRMEPTGIEPATPALQRQCSPN